MFRSLILGFAAVVATLASVQAGIPLTYSVDNRVININNSNNKDGSVTSLNAVTSLNDFNNSGKNSFNNSLNYSTNVTGRKLSGLPLNLKGLPLTYSVDNRVININNSNNNNGSVNSLNAVISLNDFNNSGKNSFNNSLNNSTNVTGRKLSGLPPNLKARKLSGLPLNLKGLPLTYTVDNRVININNSNNNDGSVTSLNAVISLNDFNNSGKNSFDNSLNNSTNVTGRKLSGLPLNLKGPTLNYSVDNRVININNVNNNDGSVTSFNAVTSLNDFNNSGKNSFSNSLNNSTNVTGRKLSGLPLNLRGRKLSLFRAIAPSRKPLSPPPRQ